MTYSVFCRRTPERRELDYLRILGSCMETAKEIRIFGFGAHLSQKYKAVSERIYNDNKTIAEKRVAIGSALALVSAAGYYAAYATVLADVIAGTITIGMFVFPH